MKEFLQLLSRRDELLSTYRRLVEEAKASAPIDNAAALKIQRLYRGVRARVKLMKKNFLATEIQRVFRGLLGRSRAAGICKLNEDRKYKHNTAKRKEWCKYLEEKNQQIKLAMGNYNDEQRLREQREAEESKTKEFTRLAQNLHHLVSIRQIRGVFNPVADYMEMPTMNNIPVEYHIRGAVKDLLRTRGIAKTGLVTDVFGTKKIPLKGLKYRLSIQASAPYDTVAREKKREKDLHKLIVADKGAYMAGGKTRLIDHNEVPLSVGNPYMDPWANPLLIKGVPRDQKQLLECAYTRKALFVTRQEKPYVTATGGNRSTTLPNDLFDVIADAQETGGAIQRHLGTDTTRFGLSQNCDNRFDGLIPKPPVRVSATLRSTTRYKPKQVLINARINKTTGSLPLQQGAKAGLSGVLEGSDEESNRSMQSSVVMQPLQVAANYDSSSDEEEQ